MKLDGEGEVHAGWQVGQVVSDQGIDIDIARCEQSQPRDRPFEYVGVVDQDVIQDVDVADVAARFEPRQNSPDFSHSQVPSLNHWATKHSWRPSINIGGPGPEPGSRAGRAGTGGATGEHGPLAAGPSTAGETDPRGDARPRAHEEALGSRAHVHRSA